MSGVRRQSNPKPPAQAAGALLRMSRHAATNAPCPTARRSNPRAGNQCDRRIRSVWRARSCASSSESSRSPWARQFWCLPTCHLRSRRHHRVRPPEAPPCLKRAGRLASSLLMLCFAVVGVFLGFGSGHSTSSKKRRSWSILAPSNLRNHRECCSMPGRDLGLNDRCNAYDCSPLSPPLLCRDHRSRFRVRQSCRRSRHRCRMQKSTDAF